MAKRKVEIGNSVIYATVEENNIRQIDESVNEAKLKPTFVSKVDRLRRG